MKDVAFPDPAWRAPQPLASSVGVFLHFGADAQKHLVLANRVPKRPIPDGSFAATRNPNYLGEVLIYSSFCLLAQHWLPRAACLLVWPPVFLPNMHRKERSMARRPEHAVWMARTGFLLPSLPTLLRALPVAFRAPRGGTARAAAETRVDPGPAEGVGTGGVRRRKWADRFSPRSSSPPSRRLRPTRRRTSSPTSQTPPAGTARVSRAKSSS